MTKNGQAGGNEVAQQTSWLRNLRQAPAAFLLGIQTRQLRDFVDAPRNEDGTYPGPELVDWWAKKSLKVAQLTPDDQERAMQALCRDFIKREEDFYQPLTEFLDGLERRYGPAGVLGAVAVWRAIWADHGKAFPWPHDGDFFLDHVNQCSLCGDYRWGLEWKKQNPRPALEVHSNDVCPACIAKGQQ